MSGYADYRPPNISNQLQNNKQFTSRHPNLKSWTRPWYYLFSKQKFCNKQMSQQKGILPEKHNARWLAGRLLIKLNYKDYHEKKQTMKSASASVTQQIVFIICGLGEETYKRLPTNATFSPIKFVQPVFRNSSAACQKCWCRETDSDTAWRVTSLSAMWPLLTHISSP